MTAADAAVAQHVAACRHREAALGGVDDRRRLGRPEDSSVEGVGEEESEAAGSGDADELSAASPSKGQATASPTTAATTASEHRRGHETAYQDAPATLTAGGTHCRVVRAGDPVRRATGQSLSKGASFGVCRPVSCTRRPAGTPVAGTPPA
jgi:hypothetical protein